MQNATWTASPPWVHSEPITDPAHRKQILTRLELLARLLDDAFLIPGTGYRIGWDGIVGLIPGVGDAAGAIMSGYIVWEAKRLGVSKVTLAKMVVNILIDVVAGAVPVVGDILDFAWKANRRNLELLRSALRGEAQWAAGPARSWRSHAPRIVGRFRQPLGS